MNPQSIRNPDGLSLIRLTAHQLQRLAADPIDQDLVEKTSLAILDYLGAIASGLKCPWASNVCQYARQRKTMPESFCWGANEDIAAEKAAFVNAMLAHSAIRDDMHLESNSHIGSIVISASLAVAQRDEWTGKQLVKAIIGGYLCASLLGATVQRSGSYNRHFRPSGICGAFGAAGAAVVADLMSRKISEDESVHALAFAANMASGLNEWAWAGGLEIYAEMGSASQAGIVACDLARAGMECSETVLEGPAGLFNALSVKDGYESYLAGVSRALKTSGLRIVQFKPSPGCNYAQTPVAAAMKIVEQHGTLLYDDIGSIKIFCTKGAKQYPGCDNSGPFTNVQQTKMSIQFGVSAVLLYGTVSEETFRKFNDPRLFRLTRRCELQADSRYDANFMQGRQPARVVVTLDGDDLRELTAELEDVPWLDEEAVVERFHREFGDIMGSIEQRHDLINVVGRLQSQKDLADLFKIFKSNSMTLPNT